MTSRSDAKLLVDAVLQSQTYLRKPFNFMGLCPEIRLMVYKEAFRECYIAGPPFDLEEFVIYQRDLKTQSDSDDASDSGESSDSNDFDSIDHLSDSDDVNESYFPCDLCEALELLSDCYGVHGRLKFKSKMGLPLASKAICTEALPVLYQMHHFKISVWKKLQSLHDRRPFIEDIDNLRYYFLRRNPILVNHMTQVEVLFDSNFFRVDTFSLGDQCLTTCLLQDIAAACPKLKTFRLSTPEIPKSWNLHFDFKPNLRRDSAIQCFRTLAQRGCDLEFQVLANDEGLVDFVHSIAPLSSKGWSYLVPFHWKKAKIDGASVWSEHHCYDLCRLSALSYQSVGKQLTSAVDPAKSQSDITAVQESTLDEEPRAKLGLSSEDMGVNNCRNRCGKADHLPEDAPTIQMKVIN